MFGFFLLLFYRGPSLASTLSAIAISYGGVGGPRRSGRAGGPFFKSAPGGPNVGLGGPIITPTGGPYDAILSVMVSPL